MAADDLHITPVADLIDHDTQGDCICGPRIERVVRGDGSDGWLHIHHTLDGREHKERQ